MAALRKYWGYSVLRAGQEQAIRAVLRGTDSLLVMPTGGGKSLCFQLPAVVMNRLCVVVSPLIALMKDQVDGLSANNYPAAAMHSHLSPTEISAIERRVIDGRVRLLYVSAKRAATRRFQEFLRAAEVRAFFIDEAHCISQWGHDFVPEYRQLSKLRERFAAASFHGFTATATARVRNDICSQLRLREPVVMVGSFDRRNLRYHVVPREMSSGGDAFGGDDDGDGEWGERLKGWGSRGRGKGKFAGIATCAKQAAGIVRRQPDGATIVYCIRRADTEDLAAELTKLGIEAKAYHAGLHNEVRREVQEAFINETLNVVVATVAFGMGIDRGDVRCVIHANMPKTVEAYQQETGRAGRDGLPAECYLLYDPEDLDAWEYLTRQSSNAIEDKVLRKIVHDEQLDLVYAMDKFANQATACRHRKLVEYFGQQIDREFCGACDVCYDRIRNAKHTVQAKVVLSAIARSGVHATAGVVIDVLFGEPSAPVVAAELHMLPTFGLLRPFGRATIAEMVSELAGAGLILESAVNPSTPPGSERAVLVLSEAGRAFLHADDPMQFTCLMPKATAKAGGGGGGGGGRRGGRSKRGELVQRAAEESPLSPHERGLRDYLRGVRGKLARSRGIPPFMIFDENTILALVNIKPTDKSALRGVSGLSKAKIDELGDEIVSAIKWYVENH